MRPLICASGERRNTYPALRACFGGYRRNGTLFALFSSDVRGSGVMSLLPLHRNLLPDIRCSP
jgi:hypothetical protein